MADQESQISPLTTSAIKSDQQPPYTTTAILFHKRKHQESNKTLVYILSAIVIISTILLIISSVFLRVVNPKLRLKSVSIQTFDYATTNSTASLNITMLTEVTVKNPNFGRYVFENCQSVALYGNGTIGGGDISGGRVGAKKTKAVSVVMRLGFENMNISGGTDVMEVISYAKMSGRVHVTKIVNRWKMIEMNCTVSFNLTSRSVMMNPLCS